MPDFQKVTPGQNIGSTPLRKAAFINALVDQVNNRDSRGSGSSRLVPPWTDTVKVRNLTGAARARGEVVQLGDYLLDPIDFRALWFEGNTVAAPVTRKIAILREPLPEDVIGLAQMSGVCVAIVDVTDEDHTHAAPVDGESVLTSGVTGPVELLSSPDGTGEQTLAVLLGSPQPAGFWATLDADLTSSGTAVAASLIDFSGTIQVKGDRMILTGMKLETGNTIYAVPSTAGEWQVLASKECPVAV